MVDLDSYYVATMVEAGFIYLGMQRFREAKEVFEGVRVMAPDSDIPVVALGNVEFCQGRFPKAIKLYRDALNIQEDSLFAKVYLGEALFFDGKREPALELLAEVRKSDPRGAAGGFATALLDAINDGFEPKAAKSAGTQRTKKETHAKTKSKKSGR